MLCGKPMTIIEVNGKLGNRLAGGRHGAVEPESPWIGPVAHRRPPAGIALERLHEVGDFLRAPGIVRTSYDLVVSRSVYVGVIGAHGTDTESFDHLLNLLPQGGICR